MLTVSCGVSSVSAVEFNSQNPETESINSVSWMETYESIDEMISDANAIIKGVVIDQTVEQRG